VSTACVITYMFYTMLVDFWHDLNICMYISFVY